MIKIKDLKGLSGCQIELMEDSSGNYFVKKTSSSSSYNRRLELQVVKQQSFQNDVIKTPLIIETGLDKTGCFYCVMEYIHGVTFAGFLSLYPFKEGLRIFEQLLGMVFSNFQNEEKSSASAIKHKIEELQSKNIGHGQLFDYLKNNIPSDIPSSFIHGDLTFENILISQNKEIFFIDFLDSFLDSPYIDLGKINQELFLHWSLRHENIATSSLIKYQKLQKVFTDQCGQNGIRKEILIYFSILTLLRILPYTKNPLETELIEINIKKWQQDLQ